MSTGTSLVTYKQTMVTRLAARSGLSGVQVSYGFPDDDMRNESIWFGGAQSDNTIPVMRAGTKKVDESYQLTLHVQVLKNQGEDQETADLRAAALLAEVQQDIAESPQPTTAIHWAQVEGWEHHVGQLTPGGGHASRFDVRIAVRARLFPS